jgi:plastocyanin
MLNRQRDRDLRRRLPALVVGAALLPGACSGAAPASASAASSTPLALSSPVATASQASTASAAPSATPGTTSTDSPPPAVTMDMNAKDSKITLDLVVKNVHYIPIELDAPANKTWHVAIDNQDTAGTLHNFSVWSGSTRLYITESWGPGEQTFDIGGLPADTYLFVCTFHQSAMRGAINIK